MIYCISIQFQIAIPFLYFHPPNSNNGLIVLRIAIMTVTFDFDAANQFENISSFDNQTKTKSSLIWFVTHRTTEIRRKSIPSQDNHQLDRVFENSTQLEVMLALNYFDSHRTKMVIVVSERNRNKNGTNFTRGTRKKNSVRNGTSWAGKRFMEIK